MTNRRDKPVVDRPAKLKSFDDYQTSLGDIMRGERATLGKSLLDVQRDLKIKAAYIAAIENSDPTAFETQGFVAGYVRSYARYLGLDPEEAYRTFCGESNFATAHGLAVGNAKQARARRARVRGNGDPLVNPAAPYLPATASRLSEIEPRAVASVAVLAALVVGLGYGGWSVLQEIQRVRVAPVAQVPGVISTVDPLAEVATGPEAVEVALSDTGNAATAEALDRLYRPQALDLPVLVARDGPISAVDPNVVGALASLVPTAPEIDASPSTPLLAEATPAEDTVQVVADAPPEVVLFAVRPAWVRVQAADGTVLFEKILDAGERYVIPQSDSAARLRAGNSGSVYFEIDGQTYGPAGDSARVAKNVALGAEDLTSTYAVADIDADPALKRIIALAQGE